MKKILFVCTGNTCRSPMAEGIFNHICRKNGYDMTAESAGIMAENGQKASENSVLALEEIGIDISSHRSKKIEKNGFDDYFKVVPMTVNHIAYLVNSGCPQEKVFLSSVQVSDPFGSSLENYKKCRDEIIKLCEEAAEVFDDDNDTAL